MESEPSVFVGDLSPEVDDALLESTFRTYYTSTKNAKVMVDPITQRSRGYGFVRFAQESDRDRALNEMSGVYIGTRPIRVSLATAKKPAGAGGVSASSLLPAPGELDSSNTTLFIGGLAPTVSEAELHAAFARFGELVYVKIPAGKGCGFVQFVHRPAAEYAMAEMGGQILGGHPIRISWGRSQSKPATAAASTTSQAAAAAAAAAAASAYPSSYYGAYDPYSAYSSYSSMGYDPYGYSAAAYSGVDPYTAAYAGYSGMSASTSGYGPPGVGGSSSSGGQASSTGQQGTPQPLVYDPLAPVNVDKLNMAYINRHLPTFTNPLKMPIPLSKMTS